MWLFERLTLVILCAVFVLRIGRCEESVEDSIEDGVKGDLSEIRKDGKIGFASGVTRKTTTPSSANATRDSQLLSVLAARRRQLLQGRLTTHINALANIAHSSNKSNTTFAQLEVRDTNNSTVKRLTFHNNSGDSPATLKLVTSDGSKEIRQEVKPQEIRHLFVPKAFHDVKHRAGFINNRRKDIIFSNRTISLPEKSTESIIYVPPEKFEGLDKEVVLDPEEEFQVDESNHGLYLLNYSDSENITNSPEIKKTMIVNGKINSVEGVQTTTLSALKTNISENVTKLNNEDKTENSTVVHNTDSRKTDTNEYGHDKDKGNNTLFMSDEIYNHFRPLETELPVEDMAPFIYFGQKLGGHVFGDNLTYSPSLSASTKSVNFITAPLEKRKFNSRYSATEKYRNTSVNEEEINEDMDVSVVKNVIEKNKVRNTVKGPAPARHVGLVNAYRKFSSTTQPTSKPPNIAQLNITEPVIQNVTPLILDKSSEGNRTYSIFSTDIPKFNSTNNVKESVTSKINVTATPRNFTRNYFNLRRRPTRLTSSSSTENAIPTFSVNATTEKVSTSVYTAVVTSVSITSSMKGPNKTDSFPNDIGNATNLIGKSNENSLALKPIIVSSTDTTTLLSTTTKPNRHRIRIRTTTSAENLRTIPTTSPSITNKAVDVPVTSELSAKRNTDLKHEATTSKISERLANLFRQNEYEPSFNGSTVRPKNILRRRRPTTTTTTTSTAMPSTSSPRTTVTTTSTPVILSSPIMATDQTYETTETVEVTFKPFIVTSRTSSKSSSKPVLIPTNITNVENTTNGLDEDETATQNEVVIEADKTYTASYVLAGLGFLPVMAIIAFVVRNVFNKKTKEIDTDYEGYFEESDVKKESTITPVARPPQPTPTKPDQKWEFPRNKLRLQTLLGQGNFGQVWKAEADDLNGHDGLTRLVAVKSIKETATQKEKQELLHEIYIMQKIGTHPNVVTLLACCTEQEPYLLIMEYVMCGKLLTYLRERRSRPDRFSGSGALTSRDLTVFAYCVARGMDYIASKGIVHRDLAARNVLVDHNKLCKIADFGLSRAAGGAARSRAALPVRWMAPEALLYNVYSHQTDVWAFGILLWEIVTLGSTPYASMTGREVLAAVTEGYRLERPPHCKPQLYRAMHSCWHADPSQRPTFAVLKSQLAELLDNEPAEGNYVDLDSFYQESSVYSDPSAIIQDDDGLSAEYDRERRVFRDLSSATTKYDNRAFNFREEDHRKFGIGTPRMGGFGIRDVPFNERNFSDGEFNDRPFSENAYPDRNFSDKNFSDTNFVERKDGKLSTSSFHRERERDNPLVSRNSFSGFPRVGTRDGHFQLIPDGRNKRVPEFECDI